jgi:hypothetical protein
VDRRTDEAILIAASQGCQHALKGDYHYFEIQTVFSLGAYQLSIGEFQVWFLVRTGRHKSHRQSVFVKWPFSSKILPESVRALLFYTGSCLPSKQNAAPISNHNTRLVPTTVLLKTCCIT